MEPVIALNASAQLAALPPRTIRLLREGSGLAATFLGGETLTLTADRLRRACRCSACRRSAIDGGGGHPADGVSITHLEDMGGRTLNIVFSDGHGRGLYPWDYLRSLAEPTPNAGDAA